MTYNGEKINDYSNGYCVRFADDICIMARTENDAKIFLERVKDFVTARGLTLSEKKTKIVNIKNGFDFLSRFYCKIDGVIRCIPSESAVKKFVTEVEELIFSNKENWSQKKLIQALNLKINGFVTYHKCEEATETFRYLDVVISALILRMLKDLYPNLTKEQLLKKYWKEDSQKRNIFTLTSNKNINLNCMADTILVNERKIDVSKNIFLNRGYYEELEKNKDIQNIVGKYKKIWDKQDGKCYICSKAITKEQEKTIIYKKDSKDKSIKNIAYVHEYCKDSIIECIKIENDNMNSINIKELLSEINNKKKNRKESKFIKLTDYFHNVHKNKVILTFKGIEKILGFKLCESAYKYASYFSNNKDGMISESWRKQGFKLTKIDMQNQKLEFTRVEFKRSKVQIPKFLYKTDLPMELVEEVKSFFLYLQEKYRIS